MPAGLGATALALIGLFNMFGTWACGWLGGRVRQQYVLGWLYLIRGLAIAVFFFLPKTDVSVLAFAAIMGLTWLGTVPLTSGLVAKIFGTEHLGTLFGICFLSHQIGSFLGAARRRGLRPDGLVHAAVDRDGLGGLDGRPAAFPHQRRQRRARAAPA